MKAIEYERIVALLKKVRNLLPLNNGALPRKFLSREGMDCLIEMLSTLVVEVDTMLDTDPVITPPPKAPLTLEELRGMNDADVWVAYPQSLSGDRLIIHALVEYDSESENVWLTNNLGGRSTFDEMSEDGGLAYRRNPEEVRHDG